MRFPERREAINHIEKLAGDLCKVDDRGNEIIYMMPKKESAYAYARGEIDIMEYEESFKITNESSHYETWSKDRTGKWIKAIM